MTHAPRRSLTLRVSVTDRCQYRCAYCAPGVVAPFISRDRLLSVDDYRRVAQAFAGLGCDKVRFTGGEPLLRRELPAIVGAFQRELPRADLALTTNGVLLAARLDPLVAAGLRRATIHVDSLRPERYATLMGDGDLAAVLAAALAARARLVEVKLNVVVQRGRNDDEVGDFIAWSTETGVQVRFIELMNTGSARAYTRDAFVPAEQIVARARASAGARPIARRATSDPAALWATDDGTCFGTIASDTQPFCDACVRVRLSADGRLRGCLYESPGVWLREALALDQQAVDRVAASVVAHKRSYHPSAAAPAGAAFSMAETGG